MDTNTTTLDMVSDARTPPKVKQQVKLKEEMENSHAGVAIPINEDAVEMDETTKKMNFYKLEKPTTNSGISTWILLSGQAASTTKPPTRKPILDSTKENITLAIDKPIRIIKPIFKKRTPSTPKPSTTTPIPISKTTTITTEPKLTKIKASLLNNAVQRKNMTTKKPNTTTEKPTPSVNNKNTTIHTSTSLPVEAKEGEQQLDSTNNTDGKKKKTATKRRKNKPKRRKPENKNNSTSISKPNKTNNNKQNAVSSQLYNYLAREIMPTVGVGLVGLMVTAGLASYFLYPFGAARRADDIDRKDKGGSYYYSDNYSGGIPEEEAIGKVIAGMPSNTLFPNNYKSTNRDPYPSTKYKLTDRKVQIRPQYYGDVVQGSVENIPVTTKQHNYQSNAFKPIAYSSDEVSRYSPNIEKKFVVGNVPKETTEEATPAAVPEHGPRNLGLSETIAEDPNYLFNSTPVDSTEFKRDEYGPRSLRIRRKRSGIPNDIENELNTLFSSEEFSTMEYQTTESERDTTTVPTTTEKASTTTTTSTTPAGLPQKVSSFIDMMKELIQFKARLGLQVIQNFTDGVSKYISGVQTRLDQQFRNTTKPHN